VVDALARSVPTAGSQGYDPYNLRPRGMGVKTGELLRSTMSPTGEYEPPLWARTLTVPATAPGQAAAQQQQQGWQPPGFPTRLQLPSLFDTSTPAQPPQGDGFTDLMQGPLGVALGAVPGEQRGGFTPEGIATAPITMANFPTYMREGLVALLSSALLDGAYQQQPGTAFGEDTVYQGPTSGLAMHEELLKGFIESNKVMGDVVWGVMDGAMSMIRDHDANHRAYQVQRLALTGNASRPVMPYEQGFIDNVATSIFGGHFGMKGSEKYVLDELKAKANRDGVDLVPMVASYYDLTPEIVGQIFDQPDMPGEQLQELVKGMPFSQEPLNNLLVEGGYNIALIAGAGGAAALGTKTAAAFGRGVGSQALEAFGVAARGGTQGALGATGRFGHAAGWTVRKAAQLEALNTAGGWTVRGLEWGIKQYAGIAGDQGLVEAMDRLLHEMPWSMNPGLNIVDGFRMHPVRHAKELAGRDGRGKRLVIGDEGGYSEALTLNFTRRRIERAPGDRSPLPRTPDGALDVDAITSTRSAQGARQAMVGGVVERLPADHPTARLMEVLEGMTLDDMHGLLRGTGFAREWLEQAFGPANRYGNTVDDLRNWIVYGYGQLVRDKGYVAQAPPAATVREASRAFFQQNAPEILDMFYNDLRATSDNLSQAIRGRWWELDALNDSQQAMMKRRLADLYEPQVAFNDALHWIGASKAVEAAARSARGSLEASVVPTYARRFERDWIRAFREELLLRYEPGERLSNYHVQEFRRRAGPVELFDPRLVEQQRRRWTREEFLSLIERIERADDQIVQTRRLDPDIPPDWTPGQAFASDARVLGVSVEDVIAIEQVIAMEAPPGAIPTGLVTKLAPRMGRSSDSMMVDPRRAWQDIIEWYQTTLQTKADAAMVRRNVIGLAENIAATAGDGRFDPERAVRVSNAAARIAAEMTNEPRVRVPGAATQAVDDGVAYADAGGVGRWRQARTAAQQVAQRAEQHLGTADEPNPLRNLKAIELEGGQLWPVRAGQEGMLAEVDSLARLAVTDSRVLLGQAETALLSATDVHPFTKIEALSQVDWSLMPDDIRVRADAIRTDGAQLLREIVNEAGVFDEAVPMTQQLESLAGQVTAYGDELAAIGDEMLEVQRLFDSIYGQLSPEAHILAQRMGRANISPHTPLVSPAARAATAERGTVVNAQRTARRELETTEARLAEAEAELVRYPQRTGEYEWAPAAGPDGMPIRPFRRRWEAEQEGDLRHSVTGMAHRVIPVKNDKGRTTGYRLEEGQRAVPEEPPARAVVGEVIEGSSDAEVRVREAAELEGAEAFDRTQQRARDETFLAEVGDPRSQLSEEARTLLDADWNSGGRGWPEGMSADTDRIVRELEGRVGAERVREAQAELDAWYDANQGWTAEGPPPTAVEAPVSATGAEGAIQQAYNNVAAYDELIGRIEGGDMSPVVDPISSEPITGLTAEHVLAELRRRREATVAEGQRLNREAEQLAAGPTDEFLRLREEMRAAQDAELNAPPPEAPPIYGGEALFQDPTVETGRQISGRWRLMEADEILDSWDEGYDQRLQPRRTDDPLRQQTVQRIADSPDPNRLLDASQNASEGPPVITPGAMTIAGNHRVRGVKGASDEAYAPTKAALARRAEEFGLTPEQVVEMRRPILVREVPERYATPRYAAAWNEATSGMTTTDVAASVARELTPDDLAALTVSETTTLTQALGQAQNAPVVARIIGVLPERARGKYVTDGGKALNPEGERLVQMAIVSRVLGEGAGQVAERVVNATGRERSPTGYLARAIMDVAGRVAEVEALMDAGRRHPTKIGPLLTRTFETLDAIEGYKPGAIGKVDAAALRRQGLDEASIARIVDDAAAITAADIDTMLASVAADPLVADMATRFRTMTRAEMGEFLDAYIDAVRNGPDPLNVAMFEEAAAPTMRDVLNRAVRAVNEQRSSRAGGSMFGNEEMPLFPDPDGVTRSTFGSADGSLSRSTEVPELEPGRGLDANMGAPEGLHVEAPDLSRDGFSSLLGAIRLASGDVTIAADRPRARMLRAFLELSEEEFDDAVMAYSTRGRLLADQPQAVRLGVFDEAVERINAGTEAPSDWLVAAEGTWRVSDDGRLIPVYRPDVEPGSIDWLDDLGALRSQAGERSIMVADDTAPPNVKVGDTTMVGGRGRTVDPEFTDRTGVVPDETVPIERIRELAETGARTVIGSGDEVAQRAGQTVGELPRGRRPATTVLNEVDDITRLRNLEDRRSRLAEEVRVLRDKASVQNAAEVPAAVDEVLFPPELLAPWGRYMGDQLTDTMMGASPPRELGEIADAIRSIDLGFPDRAGVMTPDEIAALREGLLRYLTTKLDELKAPDAIEAVPVRGRPSGAIASPAEYSASLDDLTQQLGRRIFKTDEPLEGFNGVGYDFIPPPRKGLDGAPLSTRLIYETTLSQELQAADRVVPGLGEELATRRQRSFPARVEDGNDHVAAMALGETRVVRAARGLVDTAIGPRPQATIEAQAITRFVRDVLQLTDNEIARIMDDPVAYQAYQRAVSLVQGLHRHWHEKMTERKVRLTGFRQERRVGLLGADDMQRWADEYFANAGDPGVAIAARISELKRAGDATPIWTMWRKADNRVRAYFQERPGGVAEFVERLYESSPVRIGSHIAAGLTVNYHVFRFLMDIRWLAMEFIETPILIAMREGPGTLMETMKVARGKASPEMLFTEGDQAAKLMQRWAWWLAQGEPGAYMRFREAGVFTMVNRSQQKGFVNELRRMALHDPRLRAMVKASGDTELGYIRKLDRDWRTLARRGREMPEDELRQMLSGYLDDGTITQLELDEMVKAGRWVSHPAIEEAIAYANDPVSRALLRRFEVITAQAWDDATGLIFGQVDRSNIQRLMNHPMLYWPVSYMTKATKWLGGLLFDRLWGFETGAGPAVTMDMIWQRYKDALLTDPEFAQTMEENESLAFFAQMLFPITPWDIGVTLSPWTRTALDLVTGSEEPYMRNIFGVGPGYSYFQLFPRMASELAGFEGGAGDVGRGLEHFLPQTFTVKPSRSKATRQYDPLSGAPELEPAPASRLAP